MGEINLPIGSVLKIHPQSDPPHGSGSSLVPGTRKFSIIGEGEKSFECWASSVEEEKKWFDILNLIMEQKTTRRLTIEVLSGKELNAENTYCSVFPVKEDPVTSKITEIKEETQKTPISTENGSDPVWNMAMVFRSNIPEKGYMVFRVKSKKGVQTIHLGEATLPFDFTKSNPGRVESWLLLQACKGTKSIDRFGSIRISGSIRVTLYLSQPNQQNRNTTYGGIITTRDRGLSGGFLSRKRSEDVEEYLI